jgi:hypothetical protein
VEFIQEEHAVSGEGAEEQGEKNETREELLQFVSEFFA